MNTTSTILGIIVSVSSLIGVGIGIGVAYMKSMIENQIRKLNADLTAKITAQELGFQTLREDILDKIETKLDDYLREKAFTTYSESHSKEHVRIEQEMTRLRDWKHNNADPEIRNLGAKVNKLEEGNR